MTSTTASAAPTTDPVTTAKFPTVEIINPKNDSLVGHTPEVEGTTTPLPDNASLWIVVQPGETPGVYHPQPGPVIVNPDGNWSTGIYVGSSPVEDIGKRFHLVAVIAPPEAGKEFADYLENAPREGYNGIDRLYGAQPVKQVSVTRQ